MKLPYSMLLDFVQTRLTAEEAGDLLTMAGFELEGIEEVEGDSVLDIKVMANRGDGLSAFGLAREILAKDPESQPTDLYRAADARFPSESIPGADIVRIESENCTRFACRAFDTVQNGSSPEWLQRRLRQAGQRPISLLVDLTNYVLFELGQPLHAYDTDKLRGPRFIVREAKTGEKITTLDEVERELQPNHLMICDEGGPVGVAGVMGGLATEVGPQTKRMLLEAAHFVNTSVRKTRKQLGLNTEASYRFERSVDPDGVVAALARFAALYEACTQGVEPKRGEALPVPAGVVTDVYPRPYQPGELKLRTSRTQRLLGMPVTSDEIVRYLSRLGFRVEGEGEEIRTWIPSWRPDLVREDDLIEEVGRVHGYEKIPEVLPQGTTPRGGVFGLPALLDSVREAVLRCGLDQAWCHSMRDAHPLDFHPEWRVGPRNPHSVELSLLRDSLLPGLAEVAVRNGSRNLHLFEIGRVFLKGEYQIDESPELAILSTGQLYANHWNDAPTASADFYSVKGVIEAVAKAVHVPIVFDHPRDPDPRFHPTRQSGVLVDEGRLWVGTIGQIHPDVASSIGLPAETVMAELDLLVLAVAKRIEQPMRPLSRNPAVRRDIAVLIDREVPWAQVESAIRSACGDDLERVWLFDVYRGVGIPEGKHSLAIGMQYRRMGENLTDDAANAIRDRAIAALEALGGALR